VDITWLGLSCFRIRGSQSVVITDPFPPDKGYTLGKQTADIVTVSHPHASHSYVEGVSGARVIKGPGEYEISGVLVIGITTYHDAVKGLSRGKNTIYLMEIDGVAILHLGDIGHVIDDKTLEDMGKVDILMIPVGGATTMAAAMAAETIRKIEPKIVLPMHYKTPGSKLELEPLETFLKEMGQSVIEPKPKLNVNKNNLPLTMQVVVLSI
jgi:L-ascorbate metabolism protein UlaG (beta-lactamase superfamily)